MGIECINLLLILKQERSISQILKRVDRFLKNFIKQEDYPNVYNIVIILLSARLQLLQTELSVYTKIADLLVNVLNNIKIGKKILKYIKLMLEKKTAYHLNLNYRPRICIKRV